MMCIKNSHTDLTNKLQDGTDYDELGTKLQILDIFPTMPHISIQLSEIFIDSFSLNIVAYYWNGWQDVMTKSVTKKEYSRFMQLLNEIAQANGKELYARHQIAIFFLLSTHAEL